MIAHDSLRDRIVTFRLDRIVAWSAAGEDAMHTPWFAQDWAVAMEHWADEPHQDWEDSPQGRAVAGR